ncbi:hypothetical protein OS493_021459 [Desmophyllum pertusum]|uniref:Uncharacterized protein n=1 Tax=Desmophyllum pertusum TaxID=174260 RepID=A0A9W9YYV2_9CNID|nr:hypothetical protein OS493_021459 [Desmophyllum pertusum]
MLNTTTSFQPTESLQQITETPRNRTNIKEDIENNKKTRTSPPLGQRMIEVTSVGGRRSVKFPDYDGQFARSDFCIRPRARLLSKTQASVTGKLLQLSMFRELWRTIILLAKEGKAVTSCIQTFDDKTVRDTSSNKGGHGEMPMSKRFKSDETRTFVKVKVV